MVKKFPVYCSVEDVEETLDLPDPNDNYSSLKFSDMSHPTQSRVEKLICANEDQIDRLLRRSFRENQVVDEVTSIHNHWHDLNGIRADYRDNGGDQVQLRKDILEFDPTPVQDDNGNEIYHGDRIELRTRSNVWQNITPSFCEESTGVADTTHGVASDVDELSHTFVSFWFDYKLGRLYLRHSAFQPVNDAIRISYRYGAEVPMVTETVVDDEGNEKTVKIATDYESYKYSVPSAINRMCCLMTAIQILNMQMFNIKVGAGGDLGDVRNSLVRAWQDEINTIHMAYRRSGSVHSLLR